MLVYGVLSMSASPKKPKPSSESPPNLTKKHLKIIQTSTENIRTSDSIDSLLEGKTKIEPVGLDFSAPTNMDYLSIRGNISFSELSTWRTCAFRHKLKYLDKINGGALDGPSEHTEFGHVIHTALEVFLETRKMPSYDDIKVGLSYAFSELPNVASLKEEEWHGVIEPILSEVPAFMNETFGEDWKYVASEFPLMEPIDGHSHLFKGFIDGVITATNKKGEEITHLIDWKGQRLSAPILTPKGWVAMGSLKVGDVIIGSNGQPTNVIGVFPLGRRSVYRITMKDGSSVDCTDDHLWKVYSSGGVCTKVLTTKELIGHKTFKYLPVLSQPVQFAGIFEPVIDPYVLGLLLGDGSFTQHHSTTFTSNDQELVNALTKLKPEHWEIKEVAAQPQNPRTPNYRVNGSSKDLRALKLFGHRSWEKFIPEDYLYGSPEQRLSLIQGLLDTDGWVQKGAAKLSTTSERIATDVKNLVGSLGGVAFINTRKKKRIPNEKTEYIVTVRLPKGMNPFRLERKMKKYNKNQYRKLWRSISKIEIVDEDEMQCIKVSAEDQLYVTSDYIVTHNTCSYFWPVSKKTDPNKTMQLVLYKHFYSQKTGIPLDKIRCAFVLLRRSKKPGNCEYVPVSVGPKALSNALESVDSMLGHVKRKIFPKNRQNCRFCPYANTPHCP